MNAIRNKDKWDSLSMREKSDMMKVAVQQGIYNLSDIRKAYNEYAEGGDTKDKWTIQDEANYREWRDNLPENLKYTDDREYDMIGAYKAGLQPEWNEKDQSYHLGSRDPQTGRILKSPTHPTYSEAIWTDAAMGYYPTYKNGETYTQQLPWENEYSKGGKIHIKPENRGKFTRLKERTGHSASWFKENGTPTQKKMATFELNARKWKHGDGGPLIDLANRYAEGGPEETSKEKTQWFNNWYSGRSQQLADNYRSYGINGQSSIGDAFMYLLPNRYTNDYFAKRAKESILNSIDTVDEGYLPSTKGQGTLTDAQYKLAQKTLNQSVSDINSDDSDEVYLLNVLQNGAYYPIEHTILYSPYADESTKIHERTHAAKAQFIKNAIRSNQPKLQDGVTSDKYLDNPSEIYSRLNSFRFENKLNPTDTIDRKRLEVFKKSAKDYDLLDRYDDDSLLFLLNDVAHNVNSQSQDGYNVTALGGPLVQLANKYEEGGPTDESNNIVDWIIGEEGFNSKPENIGDGKITLGSGLTNSKWHKIYNKKGTWTAEDNRAAVAEEVENRRKWAEQNVPNWSELPADSQNALLSYKYNYNFTPKNSPKLFKALEDRNYEEAARQMDATSNNPRFRKGLQARRQREQEMFMRGIDSMNAPEPEVVEEVPQEESIYTPPQRVLDNMAAHNGRYMIMGNPPLAGVRNTVLDALRRLKALNLFVEGGPLVDLANRTL